MHLRPPLIHRRGILLAATGWLGSSHLFAQSSTDVFPSRPIHLVVPYGPGGSPDVLARLLGKSLSSLLQQPVVIENKPGGNGIIAAQSVAKASNDGYTLFIADTGHLAINPALYPKLPYDPKRDFAPIALTTWTPFFLVVNKEKLAVSSVQELLVIARKRPGELSYGSSGNGSPHHLSMEALKVAAGIDIQHVPFKGVAESVPALLGGQIDMMFVALPSVAAAIQAGKLKVLAVSSAQRSALMPEIPTLSESGVTGFDMGSKIGILAPAGTPANRVMRLNEAILQALKSPDLAQRFPSLGMEVIGSSPAEYATLIEAERQRLQQVVQHTGMKID